MQGRLQGKRIHAQFFLDTVLGHGTEGCNYLLAVDVDMNTVDGYAISSWERGYGDMEFVLDLDTIPDALAAGHRDGACATWPGSTPSTRPWPRAPRQILRRAGRAAAGRAWWRLQAPSWSSSSSTTPTSRPGTPLPRPHPLQPVQRRLLAAWHEPGRAAAARHPQRHVRRRTSGRIRQGRVQPRPARNRLQVRRGRQHRRPPQRSTRTAPRRSPPSRASR